MDKLLFKSSDELKAFVGTSHKINFNTLKGYIYQATERYLIPTIGRELYDWLLAKYHGTDPLSETESELLAMAQRPLAFFTFLDAGPSLMVQTGDAGILEASGEHMTPARQWVVKDTLESWASSGDLFLDLLLAWLEKHKEEFSVWSESDSYTELKGQIISTTAQLSRFVNIQGSRRTFLALRPFLLRSQELYLEEILGPTLFAEFLDNLQVGEPTEEESKLLKACQPFIAHSALVEALPELAFQITPAGVKVLTTSDGFVSRNQAGDTALDALKNRHASLRDNYRARLIEFLNKNASDYPLYPKPEDGTTRPLVDFPDNSNPHSTSFLF